MTTMGSEGSNPASERRAAGKPLLGHPIEQWLHFPKPQTPRDYLHAALLFAAPVLVVSGLIALWFAVSFPGYIVAVMMLALAGCAFVGAQELKAKELSAPMPPPVAEPSPGTDEQNPPGEGS